MNRRAGALLLALLVVAAPVALTICEVRCTAASTAASAPGHSCHSAAPSSVALSVDAGTHVCGHEDAIPVAGKLWSPDASSVPPLALPTFALRSGIDTRTAIVLASPPGRSQTPIPLRI